MKTWTDEELQAHLKEWDSAHSTGGPLDFSISQYPVLFTIEDKTQTILRCDQEEIELSSGQVYEVNMWIRNHVRMNHD